MHHQSTGNKLFDHICSTVMKTQLLCPEFKLVEKCYAYAAENAKYSYFFSLMSLAY